jgi:hypothetical protein
MIPFEQRRLILQRTLDVYPKLQIKGGTSKTNPYKVHFEIIIAEKKAALSYYENSILWSPRYTPTHFKYMFFYPLIAILTLLWYLRYVAWPKRMLYLRNKYGYKFPELEQKGWLDGWLDDEIIAEVYDDWTLKDIEAYDNLATGDKLTVKERNSKIRQMNKHADTQGKLTQIYDLRKQAGKAPAPAAV